MYKKAVPYILLALSLICLFFGLVPPAVYGIFHVGVYFMLGLAALLFLAFVFGERLILRLKERRGQWIVVRSLFFLCAALFLFVNGAMAWSAYGAPPPPEQRCDMIILGCQVRGSSPSLMLARRLNKGAEYLKRSPHTLCIVSGGKGEGAQFSESAVMKKWLTERMATPPRIIEEDKSANTLQNIENSVKILREQGRDNALIIVTDNFHQLRARMIARRNGVENIYHLSSYGPWGLVPAYWAREYFALAQFILGIY